MFFGKSQRNIGIGGKQFGVQKYVAEQRFQLQGGIPGGEVFHFVAGLVAEGASDARAGLERHRAQVDVF
ncbi:MAG: hypothetical protein IPM98_15760 [Lewinellaceae bacterium]|nr:hypothetical protein [Lewinellaceae bacterium]